MRRSAALLIALASITLPAMAADSPAPREGSWVARDFRFHTGETVPELQLGYGSGLPMTVPAHLRANAR